MTTGLRKGPQTCHKPIKYDEQTAHMAIPLKSPDSVSLNLHCNFITILSGIYYNFHQNTPDCVEFRSFRPCSRYGTGAGCIREPSSACSDYLTSAINKRISRKTFCIVLCSGYENHSVFTPWRLISPPITHIALSQHTG